MNKLAELFNSWLGFMLGQHWESCWSLKR